MEALPVLVHEAPAPCATVLQSIVQLKLSAGAPGTLAVICPVHLPVIASTVLFTSGGGAVARGFRWPSCFCAIAGATSIKSQAIVFLIMRLRPSTESLPAT